MIHSSCAVLLMILSARSYDGAEKLSGEAVAAIAEKGRVGFLDRAFSGAATSLKKYDRPAAEAMFAALDIQVDIKYGQRIGDLELARTDKVGRSFVRYCYVEKRERGPMVWQFAFYRPESGNWQWHGFSWNDSWMRELRGADKAPSGRTDAAKLCEGGVAALKEGGVAKLFEASFTPGKCLLPEGDRKGAVEGFAKLREAACAPLGKSTGEFELVRTESFGSSLIRFVYLEKCERGAATWEFTVYRAQKYWQWLSLNLNGDIANAFATGK